MKLKIVAVLMAAVVGVVVVPNVALAIEKCPAGTLNEGAELPIAQCNIDQDQNTTNLLSTVSTILNVVLGVVGLVAVVVMILGGIGFVTSQGDAGKVTKARNTILYGLVGLVVALLAFAIVNFVLSSVFKTPESSEEGGGDSGGSGLTTPSQNVPSFKKP